MSLLSFILLGKKKKTNSLREIFIFNLPNKPFKKGIKSKSFGKIIRTLGINVWFSDFFQTIKNIIMEKKFHLHMKLHFHSSCSK